MKDKQLRGIVLRDLYNRRKSGGEANSPGEVMPDGSDQEYYRICKQLHEFGLVEADFDLGPMESGGYGIHGGVVEITGSGVNAVEDDGESSPIPLEFTSIIQHIHIADSMGIQLGNHNTMNIAGAFNLIEQSIENYEGSVEDKAEAKSILAKLMSHPVTAAIIGAAASGVAAAINK